MSLVKSTVSPTAEHWTTLFECLSQPMGKRCAIPPEIILCILAYRSRWIPSHTEACPLTRSKHVRRHRGVSRMVEDKRPIVSTGKLSDHDILALDHVIFTFRSCDQGWSSYPRPPGTYDASWTWLEMGITRDQYTDTFLGRWKLQRNRHTGEVPEDYRAEISKEHRLFTDLSKGDKIALWARALYPGWANVVHEAKIELCFYRPDEIREQWVAIIRISNPESSRSDDDDESKFEGVRANRGPRKMELATHVCAWAACLFLVKQCCWAVAFRDRSQPNRV